MFPAWSTDFDFGVTVPEKVAGNILALLKINGFTQRYAQKKCGFSTAFFSELKRRDSKHYPDTQNLLKLCDLFGIKIEEMLYVDYVSVADSKRIREIDAEFAKLKKERERLADGMIDRARKRQALDRQIEEDMEQ